MPISDKWYGCIFCKTGQEVKLAHSAQLRWPGMEARAVCAMKRRSINGVKGIHEEVIMPGYIFFMADQDCKPMPPLPDGMLRILTTVDGDYALQGRDEWFARWLLGQDGVIGVSKACRLGDRIVIREGPLKDLEGDIVRIDKRNRNGQVKLQVSGHEIKVWLPFEMVETRE